MCDKVKEKTQRVQREVRKLGVMACKKEEGYVFKVKEGESCMPKRTSSVMKKRVRERALEFQKFLTLDEVTVKKDQLNEK